jgi:hypothetical protein
MSLPRLTVRLAAVLSFATLLYNPAPASAQALLGSAQSFAVLGSSTVTNTGSSIVTGDLGVSAGTAITGFPPGILIGGAQHAADAVAGQAHSDATIAFTTLGALPCTLDLTGTDLGGLILTPGVYCFSSSAQLTGPLTLDAQGNPDAVFVFRMGSTLTTASNSSVIVINGGSHCNVYWHATSSVTLGTDTTFVGHILALASVTMTTGANLSGSAFALTGAVTLDSNNIEVASCGATGGTGAGCDLPSSVVWTSAVNVTVSGNTITKNAGCDGCFDAGAISQQTIASGDGYVEFTISPGAFVEVGLSGNAGTYVHKSTFGLRFSSGSPSFVEVRESGVYKWDWVAVAGAVYRIAVEGGVVKYSQNGVLKYTSAVAPTYPLLLNAALGSVGDAVQSAVISGGDCGGGGGDPTTPTVALTAPANGAVVSGTVMVSATASDNVSVVGIQFKLDGTNLGAEDTAAPYAITWDTTTATAGTHTLTAVARDAAGNTTTSAPVTVTVGSGGGGGGAQNVVWTSAVNVAVSGNTITKNGGCDGCWDAGAISQQTITSGDGSVEFTVSAGTWATVGLSTGNSGTSGNDITFGLRFTPDYVEVRESGVYKADWLQVAGAVHEVAVEGGVVTYYQNGVLKYTSALAPTSPLVVDATLDAIGNAVQNATITLP